MGDVLRIVVDASSLVMIGVFLLAVVPGAPLRKAIETWIQRRVAQGFDKELEDHRHQLGLEAERVKARYQSDIHNLALVAEKRHEVSRELFRLLFVAQGAIGGLFGGREVPLFEQLNREEIADYIKARRLAAALREPILDVWESDRKEGVKELTKALRLAEVSEASDEYREAYNYFLTNSLYLTDQVTDLAKNLFDTLWKILSVGKAMGPIPGLDALALRDESSELIWQLRRTLQSLLGISVDPVKAGGLTKN